MRRTRPPLIYFVREVTLDGLIKIGCSQGPAARVEQLACWSPRPLTLLASAPGDEKVEKFLHYVFADHYSHREWFHPSTDILALVDFVRVNSALPIWAREGRAPAIWSRPDDRRGKRNRGNRAPRTAEFRQKLRDIWARKRALKVARGMS